MNSNQQVKSVNGSRIRFASAKQRAKKASADVYRTYKRRTGVVTSAASREERVHHGDQFNDSSGRKKRKTISSGRESKAVLGGKEDFDESEDELELETCSTFQMELDLAKDRNASALFTNLHYELSLYVGSLPEILHHAKKIVKLLLCYVLSPYSKPHIASPEELWDVDSKKERELFVVNTATTDVLHLLSVLARDLRHEIHPYVHNLILPRIVNDLINPPTTVSTSEMKEQRTLDITVVETGFRTLSYIFRYDTNAFLSEDVEGKKKKSKKDDGKKSEGCLELMRKYYGSTLAHRADFVRRLGAESFAPLVRKLRSNASKKKHIRRVLRSLATSASMPATFLEEAPDDFAEDCYKPITSMTTRMERASNDAIDGVALLLFYTIRGVPGRLHSKSQAIIKIMLGNLLQRESDSNTENGNIESYKRYVIYKVISEVLYKARGHINNGPNFSPIWDEIYSSLFEVVCAIKKGDNSCACGLGYLAQLMKECVSYGNGVLLRSQDVSNLDFKNDQADRISHILKDMVDPKFYDRLGKRNQAHTLKLLCAAWKVFPEHPKFAHRLCGFIPTIAKGSVAIVDPILVLAKDLLPFVSEELSARYLAPEILNAAAKRNSKDDSIGVQMTLHAVAMSSVTRNIELQSSDEDKDDLFSINLAPKCVISLSDKAALIDTCLRDLTLQNSKLDKDDFVRLSYVTRVMPFLALVGCDGPDKDNFALVKKITKHITNLLKKLDKVENASSFKADFIVTKALLIEALAFIASGVAQDSVHRPEMKKIVKQAREFVNKFLFQNPASLLTVKSCAKMAIVMEEFELYLNDKSNESFDALNANLSSSNHFMRLHTLSLLNTFPQRPYVTDFNDVDLSEDLDEIDYQVKNTDSNVGSKTSSSLSGMCDIVETLLLIESTPPGFSNERRLTMAINRVEVLGRAGKLPALYAEAAVNHMFGIMHIKYQALWSASVRAITGLASGHELAAWSSISSQLKLVTESTYFLNDSKAEVGVGGSYVDSRSEVGNEMIRDHELILKWDKSSGDNADLFQQQIEAAKGYGRVSRHQSTDQLTIFEQVWSVLESIPQLTTKKSRFVVPLFLQFLHHQYFLFHDDDPDAREFQLDRHIENDMDAPESSKWSRSQLGRKMLFKKLLSFMKMFASVNGMQQLYKHKLLLVIFTSFLSNPDPLTAKLSLDCVIRFKLPHVRPYLDQLKGLLMKGTLRETLTKMNLSRNDGDIDVQHREQLFPIIIRILFGRLSARGSGNKSSKDSPAVRRAAILSFLSGLDQSEGEFDYFIYTMVRPFVPSTVDMDLSDIGHGNKSHIKSMIKEVYTMASMKEVSTIPSQRQEGLLNLLSEVIKKFGFKVLEFVPTFMRLILIVLEHAESLRKESDGFIPEPQIEAGELNDDGNEMSNDGRPNRAGKIRTLCFLRLSDLMSQFANSANFIAFGDDMKRIIQPALKNLPNSTINAANAPGLLILLQTMSSHPELIPLLEQDNCAVQSVFKCISDSSNFGVMDCTLKFVDNLLTEGGLYDPEEDLRSTPSGRTGLKLVRANVDLLLSQFTRRLKCNDDDHSKLNATQSQELSILCRVTYLLVENASTDDDLARTLSTLCDLLIPFLRFGRNIREKNRLDILDILSSILPRIGHEAAYSHLQAFARLLGPNRGKAGIKSIDVRQRIVACIAAIATNESELSKGLSAVVAAMHNLNTPNPKRVDEWDFEKVLPVLNGLGSESSADKSWYSFSKSTLTEKQGLKVLMPLMFCCLQLLYDTDGVLSRGAFKALCTLIKTASEQSSNDEMWQRLIETSMMASIRIGIKTHNLAVRKSFILLLSLTARSFATKQSPHLCSDLVVLINDDDPELDFFLNITHVQIHRRSRALARLRKFLGGFTDMNDCTIQTQSLMSILLPLALHPIYECEKKGEEAYAAEAIATVGTITKYLPWGKYQSTLWTALTQISRHESQERYVVAMVCAIIDSFHFDVIVPDTPDADMSEEMKSSEKKDEESRIAKSEDFIWKQLNKKMIPTIESYLMKDTVDRKGKKNKTLRSQIALALVKLFQKLPQHVFEMKFPRLLSVVCQSLTNNESDERDIARKILSRVAASIDVKYLSDIIAALAVALNEGYKLHVRSATLHSILIAISKVYVRPEYKAEAPSTNSFDSCVPAMMDIIQQDIFGTASEMKEVETARKRLVKEAGGTKSLSSLELIGRLVQFNPSSVASSTSSFSAVHALVNPFLERLRDPEVLSSIIGKAKESMSRIVIGISQNSSSSSAEMLPFVFATVSPFVIANGEVPDNDDDMYDSDEERVKGLEVSKTKRSTKKEDNQDANNAAVRKVFNWAPSGLKDAKDSKSAYEMKIQQKLDLRMVQDGANAPKLTGSSRYDSLKSKGTDLNSPATSCAVSFGLSLLHAHLKMNKSNGIEMMCDPFVKILTRCVKHSNDTNAILVSLKCLQVLLRLNLPSITIYRMDLAKCILKILSSMSCNTQNEMVQGSFKTLTLLLAIDKKSAIEYLDNTRLDDTNAITAENKVSNNEDSEPILNQGQMQVLVSILLSALTDAEHHNSTFGVIKALTSRKYVSPEYYDLMDTILKMTVQSQKGTMRQQAAKIFMQYLIEYPMGKNRLESHLKQMVLNIKYDYEDGRMSALDLINAVINKLPLPLLEECTQLLFLPLVLQMVNDDSKRCRERVGECLTVLLSRLSTTVLNSLYEYSLKWSADDSAGQLQRTSVQLFGLFLDARLDFMKKNNKIEKLVDYLRHQMDVEIGSIDHTNVLVAREWEMTYFCLQTIEKVGKAQKHILWRDTRLWEFIIQCLAHPHPWVKLVASRTIFTHLSTCELKQFQNVDDNSPSSIILKNPGSLFEITRNLCFELNSEEEHQSDDITTMAIKNLSWVIRVMHEYPALCFKDGERSELAADESGDDNEESTGDRRTAPVTWLIIRLSNIAKKVGYQRREAIFKCFAAFATVCDKSIICNHLELILEPLSRVITDAEAREERSSYKRGPAGATYAAADLPREVLQLLEDKCGTEVFINTLASVKSKAKEKREARKQKKAVEAVQDPESAAKRKIAKQQMEKQRKKRRVHERKVGRGVFTKKPRH